MEIHVFYRIQIGNTADATASGFVFSVYEQHPCVVSICSYITAGQTGVPVYFRYKYAFCKKNVVNQIFLYKN